MTADQIEREALKLPASERARLAERLIASLDEEAELEKEWMAEVRRRDEELDTGAVEAVPVADVLRVVREDLNGQRG